MNIDTRELAKSGGLVFAGVAALGWISVLPDGARSALGSLLVAPSIVIGLSVALAPALYIGISLAGATTDTRTFLVGLGRAWRATGLAAVGLAPALLFLVATSTASNAAFLLGMFAIGFALLVGLTALVRVANEHSPASLGCFVVWSAATFFVGAKMFARVAL